MSSSETVTTAEQTISNYAFFFIEDCANYAEATVIFHEYLITLDSEIRLIWRRKITGASVLFFLNRYIMVFQNAITVGSYWPLPNTSCFVLGWMDIVLNLLPYFIWNAFSTMRVYALSGRDWRLALLVCFIMLGPIVANAYNIPMQTPVNLAQPYNCEVANSVTVALHTKLVLGSRISCIIGDAFVLAITWWKTYRLKKAADEARVKMSIVDLLLRDGTIYFGTMLVLNVLHILINFVEKVSFMGDIADVLTSILVSRFIMNLRDVDSQDTGLSSRADGAALETWNADPGTGMASEHRGTLVFASNFVESMGGPLERGEDTVSEEMAEEEDGSFSDRPMSEVSKV